MNWRLSLLALLLVLSLGGELCSSPSFVVVKDQPHSVFVLDDDLAELSAAGSCVHDLPWADFLTDWADGSLKSRPWGVCMTVLQDRVVPAETHRGVRWHRELCVERC